MDISLLLGVVLFLSAGALLCFGYISSKSVGEQVNEAVTSQLTESTTWCFVFGIAAAIGVFIVLTFSVRG